MILINIKIPVRPDKMDEWLALAASYAKDVNSEDGCLSSSSPGASRSENEFVCIEGFKDAKAGGYHVKQPYVKAFFDTTADLVSAQPQIIYIDTPHEGFGPMGRIPAPLPAAPGPARASLRAGVSRARKRCCPAHAGVMASNRTVSQVKPVMMLARWNSPPRWTRRGAWPKPAPARAMVASMVTAVPPL